MTLTEAYVNTTDVLKTKLNAAIRAVERRIFVVKALMG